MFVPLLAAGFALHYAAGDNARWLGDLGLLLLPDELLRRWTMGVSAAEGLSFERAAVLDRLEPTVLAALWLAASWGAGAMLLFPLRWHGTLRRDERAVMETAAGLVATSLLTLALGLAGLLLPWLFRSLAAALLAGGIWMRVKSSASEAEPQRQRSADPPETSPWPRRIAWLTAPLLLVLLALALLPPWEFDVMEYHLQVPKEWRQAGRIEFLPHNVYGNMPLGAELHPLATMTIARQPDPWFLGALAGKLVMACFAPLAAAGLWCAGRRWLSPSAGAWAALLLLTVPWVIKISTIGHNEVVIGAYALLALYSVIRWTELIDEAPAERPAGEPPDVPLTDTQRATAARSWLLLGGWMLGGAAACKYTAVAFFCLPLWLAVLLWRGRLRLRPALLLLAAALAAGGLWYAKNAVVAGNPIYPLGYSVFGGRSWDEQKAERWKRAHFAGGHRVRQLADSASRVAWRAPDQSFALPALMLLGVLPWGWPSTPAARRLRRWLVWLMLFVFVVWWGVTHRLERFLVPLAPLAALLAGGAAAQLDRPTGKWTRGALTALAVVLVLMAAVPAVSGRLGDFRLLVSLDELRYDRSLIRVHPAHLMLNTRDGVPEGKRVLLVAEAQVFNLEVPHLYSTCFDDTPLEQLVDEPSADARRRAFAAADISHVFVHWGELNRYRQAGNYGFPQFVTRELFEQLQRQNVLREIPIFTPDGEVDASSSLFQVIEPAGDASTRLPAGTRLT